MSFNNEISLGGIAVLIFYVNNSPTFASVGWVTSIVQRCLHHRKE